MTATSPKTVGLWISLFLGSCVLTLVLRSPSFSLRHSTTSTQHHSANNNEPKVAFATFLAGSLDAHNDPSIPDEDDGYFLGARVLTYQLLHSPITSTNASIPFLILVTPDVSARKRARLAADGATIVPVAKLESSWVHPAAARWRDVLSKLRLWEQTSYTKICFMDSDTLVTKRLDGIFWDEATLSQPVLHNAEQIFEDEAVLPRTYMLATHADYFGYDHAWPPDPTGTYLNCGFFVFSPDADIFAYYMSLLANPGKFDSDFPEQNLLNYAHRKDGNMPWKMLWHGWNVNWPTERDLRGGAASFHAKYWDGDPTHDRVLKAIWREQRAEMEGFWRGREGRDGRIGGVLGG